jgi:hypothetical protein
MYRMTYTNTINNLSEPKVVESAAYFEGSIHTASELIAKWNRQSKGYYVYELQTVEPIPASEVPAMKHVFITANSGYLNDKAA